MALNPLVQFDETSLTSAEFDPQDKVLPNSSIASNDVNAIASRALRRTSYLRSKLLADNIITYTFAEEGVGPSYVIGPPNLFNSATYTDSKVVVEVPGCLAGDDIEITAWGDWQLNTASSADVVGRARLEIREDVDNVPVIVPGLVGKAAIVTPGGGALPHISNYTLRLRHRIVSAGKARVALQIATEDLTGGAGTATVILMLSARMDVKRIKRS